jgi:hypothetical protein
MPAVSKAQQRLAGFLKANPAEAKRRGMTKFAKDFSHGPGGSTKSLPERKRKRGK